MSAFYLEDLRISTEILAILDSTNSPESKSALLSILNDIPISSELVIERQRIICGFINNLDILNNFHYHLGSLNEVRLFLEQATSKKIDLMTSKVKGNIKWFFSAKMRQQDRSRCVQLIQFFYGLKTKYIDKFDLNILPNSYKTKIYNMLSFFDDISVEKYYQIIVNDEFSASNLIAFSKQIVSIDTDSVKSFWEDFHSFEAHWSIALFFKRNDWTTPIFSGNIFSIKNFYHPLVKNPVRNTINMIANENAIVLTGPNMSGKSTLLKSISLCVYFARIGLFVPAKKCCLPFFESILVSIDSRDSLDKGLSHFMVELRKIRTIMEQAAQNKYTFAVFDEIFSGTNVEDATEILDITLRGVGKFEKLFFIASTHLLQAEQSTKAIPSVKPYFIECTLEDMTPKFSYKLVRGWSQLKIGQILFRSEKLDLLFSDQTSSIKEGGPNKD